MKTKLLAGFGLILAIVGMSLVFNTSPAQAKGEKYKWINATTIEGSGGSYDDLKGTTCNTNGGKVTFTGSNLNYKAAPCCPNCIMTLTASVDNTKGTLKVIGCNVNVNCSEIKGRYDAAFTIADPTKGPPPGTNIDYTTVNCSTIYQSADIGLQQCEAVKTCITVAGKKKDECLAAWTGCTNIANADGNITFEEYQKCRTTVGSGDLTDTPPPAPATTDTKPSSCPGVIGIGWIICPVFNFMAQIVNAAYGFVSSLLSVQPLYTTEMGGSDKAKAAAKGVYDAWSIMRNVANIAFVIAFLLIIFSQITSVGITNYGVKKLLPRIIVSAILVNISYWICAAAVDISNILGASLHDLFLGMNAQLATPNAADFGATGPGWVGITAAALIATGAALYVTLSALLPALVAALLAIVTVFLVLTLRQALIILLIIISPLAFVAYLLPNTESLFKKWLGLLKTLLLMYPIISLIFGTSALASTIVMSTVDPNNPYKIVIQIMGALIAIIPLAITPIVMKTAGGVLGKVGGFVNNPNKGPFDRLRKRAEGYRDTRQNIAGARRLGRSAKVGSGEGGPLGGRTSRRRRTAAWLAGSGASAGLNRELQEANAKKALADAKQDYVVGRVGTGDAAYAKHVAGPTGDVAKITMAAIAAQKNETAEAIKNAQISANIPPGDLAAMAAKLTEAIDKNDDVTARAMQNMLLNSGSAGIKEYRAAIEGIEARPGAAGGAIGGSTGDALRENILQSHGGIKASAADIMEQATKGGQLTTVSANPDTWSLSDAQLASQTTESVQRAVGTGAITRDQALRILDTKEIAKDLKPDARKALETLR